MSITKQERNISFIEVDILVTTKEQFVLKLGYHLGESDTLQNFTEM